VNGNAASGGIRIFDPDGNEFYRQLNEGIVKFFFDKTGRWKIQYGNKTKEIEVVKTKKPTPTQAILGAPSSTTGLITGGINPVLGALLLLLLLAAALWYKFFYKSVRITRSVSSGKVKIRIKNRWRNLQKLRVLEIVPEKSASSHSIKPLVKETVTGDLLEWKFEKLAQGQEISIEHSFAGKELTKPVELKAETEDGKSVFFTS
ncbi:MAG: hypothetical protein V1717_01210, partial [Candidatus Micrarchaeota archaeon]